MSPMRVVVASLVAAVVGLAGAAHAQDVFEGLIATRLALRRGLEHPLAADARMAEVRDGARALLATYTWDHNGNVELPRVAQALYVVKPSKAYVLHYEGAASGLAEHAKDLQELYASFKTARLDGGGHPIIEDLNPKIPKGRDMNADALKGAY